jgi:hypothetical protein
LFRYLLFDPHTCSSSEDTIGASVMECPCWPRLQPLPCRPTSQKRPPSSTPRTCSANCSVQSPGPFSTILRHVGKSLIHYCFPMDGPRAVDRVLHQFLNSSSEEESDGSLELMVVAASLIHEYTERQRPVHRGSTSLTGAT